MKFAEVSMKIPRILAAAAAVGATTLGVHAAPVTGNPITDGWTLIGNSLAQGTYVRGVGGINFDAYSTSFSLGAGSNLAINGSWLAGDTILGLGGIVNGTVAGIFNGYAKFGGVGSTFAPASNAASCQGGGAGCGAGSFSGGNGGQGSVQANYFYVKDGINLLNPNENGAAVSFGTDSSPNTNGNLRYYNGGASDLGALRPFATMIANFDGTNDVNVADTVSSWGTYFNTSAMSRAGYNFLPQVGAQSIVTYQIASGAFTDAVGPIAAAATQIPEPETFALVLSALAVLGFVTKRRKA